MPGTASVISLGELRLMALAAVNEDLDRALRALADGGTFRLSGLAYHDRLRLKEAAIENDLRLRGITVAGD